MELRRRNDIIDMAGGPEDFIVDRRRFVFEIFPFVYVKASDIQVGQGEDLFVLPKTFFEGRAVVSVSAPVGLQEFCRELPQAEVVREAKEETTRKERVSKDTPGFREAMLKANPWMTDDDLDKALGNPLKAHTKTKPLTHLPAPAPPVRSLAVAEAAPEAHAEADDEGAELSLYDPGDLAAMRAAEEVAEHRVMDFYVRVQGGAWTMEHTGQIADGCAFFARAGDAKNWCRRYRFPAQKGFHYRKYGGREGPHMLCNEIARKAQYFYDMFASSGSAHFVYSEGQKAAYQPSADFREWCAALEAGSVTHRAALAVQALYPGPPQQ